MRGKPIETLRRFAASENGATAIEYGLLASLIAAVVIGSVSALGTGIRTLLYDKIMAGF